jgi:hypothetical protein
VNHDGTLMGKELLRLAEWVWSSFHPDDKPMSKQERSAIGAELIKTCDAMHNGSMDFGEFEWWFYRTCEEISSFRWRNEQRRRKAEAERKERERIARSETERRKREAETEEGMRRAHLARHNKLMGLLMHGTEEEMAKAHHRHHAGGIGHGVDFDMWQRSGYAATRAEWMAVMSCSAKAAEAALHASRSAAKFAAETKKTIRAARIQRQAHKIGGTSATFRTSAGERAFAKLVGQAHLVDAWQMASDFVHRQDFVGAVWADNAACNAARQAMTAAAAVREVVAALGDA